MPWSSRTSIHKPAGVISSIETRDYRTEAGYWIGIRIDVTQRREAERKLQEPRPIADVYEDQATEAARAMDPSAQPHLGPDVRFGQLGDHAAPLPRRVPQLRRASQVTQSARH